MFKRRSYGIGGALLKVGSNLAQGKGFGSGALQGVGKAAMTPGSGIGAGAELAGNLLQKSDNPLANKIGKGLDVASNFAPGGGGVAGAVSDIAGLAGGTGAGAAAGAGGAGGAGLVGALGNLAQNAFQQKYGGMNGVRLMKRGGYNPGVISAQVGFGDIPSADFLLALNEEKESDPLFIQMSPARPGEEMDTMGYTTAVDKTSIGKTIPVPPPRGPVVIKEPAPTPPEEVIETRRPTDMQIKPTLPPPTITPPEKEIQEPAKTFELPSSRNVVLFGHGPQGGAQIHRLSQDGKVRYASPESHAAFVKDLYEVDPAVKVQLDKMMDQNPGMTLEEAALRKAMGKTSYYDINNTSYEDLLNKAAQDTGGVDLYEFAKQASRKDIPVNMRGLFGIQ